MRRRCEREGENDRRNNGKTQKRYARGLRIETELRGSGKELNGTTMDKREADDEK